jgi:uncharacterized protein (DUF427 family)
VVEGRPKGIMQRTILDAMAGQAGPRSTRPERVTPRPGQESVWDYPRPPRVEPVPERLRVVVDGVTVAETEHGIRVLETAGPPVYYFPPADVRTDLLSSSAHRSVCEWKGRAVYHILTVGPRRIPNVGWSYPDPLPGFEAIRDHVAFYAGRVDEAWVGEERATPQPGRFYGGWVTSKVVGPFKGEPGTSGW